MSENLHINAGASHDILALVHASEPKLRDILEPIITAIAGKVGTVVYRGLTHLLDLLFAHAHHGAATIDEWFAPFLRPTPVNIHATSSGLAN